MTDTSRLLHSLQGNMNIHHAALDRFCVEYGVTEEEAARLFDTSEEGSLKQRLDGMRLTCGLWSPETHDRYAGVIRRT